VSTSELFHVGIVVPDIEAALQHFSDLLGIVWGPVVVVDAHDVRDRDGNDLSVPTTLCYSTSPPYLELIQETPGTVWMCNEHSNLHHIGFWSDALAADSDHLVTALCPLEVCGREGGRAPVSFTYHRDPLGVRIELIDAAMRHAMEQYNFEAPSG
jgi:catechol 2,3-dioxygenase-like lactoylglutathione lyase family enzyme